MSTPTKHDDIDTLFSDWLNACTTTDEALLHCKNRELIALAKYVGEASELLWHRGASTYGRAAIQMEQALALLLTAGNEA
jgi:hypothetical protein